MVMAVCLAVVNPVSLRHRHEADQQRSSAAPRSRRCALRSAMHNVAHPGRRHNVAYPDRKMGTRELCR